jgi:hypothetical protein
MPPCICANPLDHIIGNNSHHDNDHDHMQKAVTTPKSKRQFEIVHLSLKDQSNDNSNMKNNNNNNNNRDVSSASSISTASTTATTTTSKSISSFYMISKQGEDPCAKKSSKVQKSNFKNNIDNTNSKENDTNINNDGDIWIQKRCVNKKNGRKKFLFVSVNTGTIVREPPTGASRVIYSDDLIHHYHTYRNSTGNDHSNANGTNNSMNTIEERMVDVSNNNGYDDNRKSNRVKEMETIYFLQA